MEQKTSNCSLDERLCQTEASGLETFASILSDFNPNESDEFTSLVGAAVERYGITPVMLTDQFGATRGTISRWISGKSLPHALVRPMIIDWIREQVLLKAAERRRQGQAPESSRSISRSIKVA